MRNFEFHSDESRLILIQAKYEYTNIKKQSTSIQILKTKYEYTNIKNKVRIYKY